MQLIISLSVSSLGMKTGMKGTERLLMTSRKGPQTVKTGQFISQHKHLPNIFVYMLKSLTPVLSMLSLQPEAHTGGGALVGAVV